MLTLFHAPQSRSSRLVWLVEELNADCRIEYVSIRRVDGSGAPDARNPHPDGKVPALRHDKTLVTESGAVALYLTGLHPEAGLGFAPGSPQRGALLTWLFWAAGEFEPSIWSQLSGETATHPDAKRRYDAAVQRLLDALWAGPWLMGEQFTVADVIIGSTIGWARAQLPDSPLLDAYLNRLTSRPAHQRARARDAEPIEA